MNSPANGSRLDALAALLRDRDVDERLATALLDFAGTSAIEACSTQASQLPLSTAADAYAAVYVGPRNLAIALDPGDAKRAGDRMGLRVEQRSKATWLVHLPPEFLDDEGQRAAVFQLLHEAFERAFQGPRWERGLPDRRLGRGEICPTCFLEKPVAGPCPNCD